MNIIVCVKPVPDTSIIEPHPDTGRIDENDLVYIINPYDMVAVEAAVRIREAVGGRVTLITVAPPSTKRLLRRCLALGADDARLIWDERLAAADSSITGAVLAAAIATLEYDLVLCGQKAIDTEAGLTGSVIAARLNLPLALRVAKIDVAPGGGQVNVESKLERGNRAKIEVRLPAVLTVESDLNEPRYASLPALLEALDKDIRECGPDTLGLTDDVFGLQGVRTETVATALPKPRPRKIFTPDASLSAQERLRLIMSGGITQKQSDTLEGDPAKIAGTVIQFLREKKFLPE